MAARSVVGRWAAPGVRWDEETARAALAALAASGKGTEVFAREHGFSAQRLRAWRGRLSQPGAERAETKASLVPVVVRSERGSAAVPMDGAAMLVVRVGRAAIEVRDADTVDAAWLGKLVREIGGEP